ncbi:MAG TPA: FAD-dependent oxidoreductase [Bacteroidales bacterium]|nr:FAD-dependent oxidoreductase [Bacteroidales bacterium]
MSSPRKVKAVVVGLKRYIDDITWYRLKPEFSCRFKPGQFLHLALDSYDPGFNWPESRVLSIANAPGREYIDILVSSKGRFTNRMINELSIGAQVWLKLPYGIFNFNDSVGKDVVLVAGGTGISPFVSFLENIFENKDDYRSINLFYRVREPDLVVFEKNIEKYKQNINGFHYRLFCENINSSGSLPFEHGILPVKEIVNQTVLYCDPVYYLSGPKAMIESFEKELTDKEILSDKIFFDKWE